MKTLRSECDLVVLMAISDIARSYALTVTRIGAPADSTLRSHHHLRPLQRRHPPLQPRPQIAMRPARQQPRLLELAQVPLRGAGDEAVHVAIGVIAAGEYFEEGDAFEHVDDAAQARADFRGLEVVQHVGADDEIEAGIEAQVFELAEGGQADVAAAAVAVDHVLAGVQPAVARLRAQRAQVGAPRRFAAAHVEHAADGATEVVLGLRHGQRHLAAQLGGRGDGVVRVAVPLVEIGAIVGLGHGGHPGGQRAW